MRPSLLFPSQLLRPLRFFLLLICLSSCCSSSCDVLTFKILLLKLFQSFCSLSLFLFHLLLCCRRRNLLDWRRVRPPQPPSNFFKSQLHFAVTVRPTCHETEYVLPVLPLAHFHNFDHVSSKLFAPSLIFEQAFQDIQFRFFLQLDQ